MKCRSRLLQVRFLSHILRYTVRLILGALGLQALLLCSALAQIELIEPEPFRRDNGQLEGREFDFGRQDFVDRFSYRFDPDVRRTWEQTGEGLRITGGSISTDETYLVSQFKKRWYIDEPVYLLFRFRQDEDLDDDFSRFLYGFGFSFLDNFNFAAMSNVERDKENIDLQFELSWREFQNKDYLPFVNPPATPSTVEPSQVTSPQKEETLPEARGSFARLGFIFADFNYNGAAEVGRYTKDPYTIFLEGLFQGTDSSRVHLWLNYIPQLELELDQEGLDRYQFEQFRAGVRGEIAVSSDSLVLWGFKGQTTEIEGGAGNLNTRDLDRDFFIADLEYRTDLLDGLRGWVGYRYLTLDEKDRRPDAIEGQRLSDRLEHVTHFGVRWRFHERFALRPTMFLTVIDNDDEIGGPEGRITSDSELLGRILFPLEYYFPRANAMIVVNPTLEWPGDPFGGLNVQAQFSL